MNLTYEEAYNKLESILERLESYGLENYYVAAGSINQTVFNYYHGYSLEKFKDFLDKVGLRDEDFLYILGDVIDRGHDGVKILKWLMLQPNVELLLGNHEAMMLACDFLFDEITEHLFFIFFVIKSQVLSCSVLSDGIINARSDVIYR